MENDNKCHLCNQTAKKFNPGRWFIWEIDCSSCEQYQITWEGEELLDKMDSYQLSMISEYIKNLPMKSGGPLFLLKPDDINRIVEEGKRELELKSNPRKIGFK